MISIKCKQVLILSLAIAGLIASSGCTTTRSENGVMIQQKRSVNPLDYIPFL